METESESMTTEKKETNKDFVNPIDADKVAENPGLLPYAHTVGGVIVKPEDKGKIKGRAVAAMHQQTEVQMKQLYEQMELLARQAKKLQDRMTISERIYCAEMRFEPLIAHTYYLYTNKHDVDVLTMVAPSEWSGKMPYKKYLATVKLLSDHTWDLLEKGEAYED